jgi:hypothetical protein
MQGEGATAFAIPAAPLLGKLLVAVMGTGGRAIVSNRNNPGILSQYRPHVLFYAMGPLSKTHRQLHENIIKIWFIHTLSFFWLRTDYAPRLAWNKTGPFFVYEKLA